MTRVCLTLLCALCAAGAGFADDDDMALKNQVPKVFRGRATNDFELKYLLSLPAGYDPKAEKQWPLMLFLHGAGERGTNLAKVAAHGPPKLVKNNQSFPFIIVSPQCASGQIWSDDALLGLLDQVMKEHQADPARVYLTGLSMGGYGTWNLGLRHPRRFAAIAPICGGGDLLSVLLAAPGNSAALKSLPVWAFHGARDSVVPLAESERMVAALKRAGNKDAKLTVYPQADHDSWTETYHNPDLYDWFLAHKR